MGFTLTPGEVHDSQAFDDLLALSAQDIDAMLADKAYDSDHIRASLAKFNIKVVILYRSNRIKQIAHNKRLYRMRNQFERMFNRLKN